MVPDNQARLDFLEAAIPALVQQRNEALDTVVRVRAEASMQVAQMQRSLQVVESRVKELTEGKPANPVE